MKKIIVSFLVITGLGVISLALFNKKSNAYEKQDVDYTPIVQEDFIYVDLNE